MVTVHVPVPEHAPDQPAKLEPVSGVAVRVTLVPASKNAAHVGSQWMPSGLLVTVPDPVPAFVTVSVYWSFVNVALTLLAASIVTLHVPVPEHAPVHPANVDIASGVAVSVTTVPNV
jgi:hypothetical protein